MKPFLVLSSLALCSAVAVAQTQVPGTTSFQQLPVVQSDVTAPAGTTSTPTGQVAGQVTAGGRIDFGTTPDDFGGGFGPFPGPPGLPLATQYQQGHIIVFGAAVDKGVPPTTLVSDAACADPDRSAGSPEYATDWWCQFIDRAGVRHGVTDFRASVCFIDSPVGTTLLEGYNNDCVLIASSANSITGDETLSLSAPANDLIAYVRMVSSVDPAGLTIDCLDFPDPIPRQSAPETGIHPIFNFIDCNAGFIAASSTTRTGGLCAPPVVCPFPLAMPAIPGARIPVADVITWNYLANSAPPSDTILINATPVTGGLVGQGTPDLCWGRTFGLCYQAIIPPGIVVYGGGNTIDMACDGMLTGAPDSLGEGITIATIYASGSTTGPVHVVEVYAGYTSTQSSGTGVASATLPFRCGYGGGPARMLLNALDGQNAGDDLFVNGALASGVLAGTNAPGDAWIGFSGPCATDNLYDVADDNIGPFMTHGDGSVTIDSTTGGDCIGHSLAIISHRPYDIGCFGCQTTRYCNPGTGSPNNLATINIDHCFAFLRDCDNFVAMHGAPPNQFTYLLVGDTNGIVTNPPGALGDLCIIGGCISRFIADAGAINAAGSFATDISNSLSGGNYGLPATCGGTMDGGETWYMQYWHRDGMNPSRFSEAMCVVFQ